MCPSHGCQKTFCTEQPLRTSSLKLCMHLLPAGPLGKSVDLARQPLTAAGSAPAQPLTALPSLSLKKRPSLGSGRGEQERAQPSQQQTSSGITPLLGAQEACIIPGFVCHRLQGTKSWSRGLRYRTAYHDELTTAAC